MPYHNYDKVYSDKDVVHILDKRRGNTIIFDKEIGEYLYDEKCITWNNSLGYYSVRLKDLSHRQCCAMGYFVKHFDEVKKYNRLTITGNNTGSIIINNPENGIYDYRASNIQSDSFRDSIHVSVRQNINPKNELLKDFPNLKIPKHISAKYLNYESGTRSIIIIGSLKHPLKNFSKSYCIDEKSSQEDIEYTIKKVQGFVFRWKALLGLPISKYEYTDE